MPMTVLGVFFSEFMQNTVLILPFTSAAWLWKRCAIGNNKAWAIACMIVSGIAGPLFIYFTEPFITGTKGDVEGLLGNMVVMGALVVVFVLYLSADSRWSNWKTDLVLAVAAGVLLTVVQAWFMPDMPAFKWIVHGLAMIVTFPIILFAIRLALARPKISLTLLNMLVVTAAISFFIIVLDYV